MACFIVPATMGVVTTTFRKRFPKELHIDWLNKMIWGGVVALAVEHIAHGEITIFPPFLTAMSTPEDTATMLGEMAAVGIPMTVAVVLVWTVMVVVYEKVIVAGRKKAIASA